MTTNNTEYRAKDDKTHTEHLQHTLVVTDDKEDASKTSNRMSGLEALANWKKKNKDKMVQCH